MADMDVGFSLVEPGRRGPLAKLNGEGTPQGQTDWGAIFFGYFSLGMQRQIHPE